MTRHSKDSALKILDAALVEIARGGSGGLRVDTVATRAEVNKRMIYHHFGGREGLLRAGFARLAREVESLDLDPDLKLDVEFLRLVRSTFLTAERDEQLSPTGELPFSSIECVRLLLAELFRVPEYGSERLLSRISNKNEAEPKPVLRFTAMTRQSNPASNSP